MSHSENIWEHKLDFVSRKISKGSSAFWCVRTHSVVDIRIWAECLKSTAEPGFRFFSFTVSPAAWAQALTSLSKCWPGDHRGCYGVVSVSKLQTRLLIGVNLSSSFLLYCGFDLLWAKVRVCWHRNYFSKQGGVSYGCFELFTDVSRCFALSCPSRVSGETLIRWCLRFSLCTSWCHATVCVGDLYEEFAVRTTCCTYCRITSSWQRGKEAKDIPAPTSWVQSEGFNGTSSGCVSALCEVQLLKHRVKKRVSEWERAHHTYLLHMVGDEMIVESGASTSSSFHQSDSYFLHWLTGY